MRFYYLVLLLCLACLKGYSSDSLSLRYLSIDQGLSNSAVTSIHKDHNGFMWFGTYDGLNKYDGYGFTVFKNVIGDTTSLVDNHVYCVSSDSRNNIWVGTTKGVSIYDATRASFHIPRFLKAGQNKTAALTYAGLTIKQVGDNMLVGTANDGLIVFDKPTDTGRQVVFSQNGETFSGITCIEYDSLRGDIWLFITGAGLCKYNPANRSIALVATGITTCTRIFISSSGAIFLSNNNGVFRLNSNAIKLYSAVPRINVRDITEDAQHTFWLATDGDGLWYLPQGAGVATRFSMQNRELNSNSIYDIYIDANGRKWIGTLRGGVNLIERNASVFKTISYNSDLLKNASDFIMSFGEDEKQNLWIGTDGAGLRYWDRANNRSIQYVHSSDPASIGSNFITGITTDTYGDTWVSTWYGGINKLDKTTQTFSHYHCYDPIAKYNNDNVWFLYKDDWNRLWASSINNGYLFLYNRKADRFEMFDTALVNLQVMTEDNSGNLWGGNYTSLIKIDTTRRKHIVFTLDYPVKSIQEDRSHNFWVGTEGGGLLLFNRATGRYKQFSTKDGLPSNTVLRILEDSKGNLWLSTYYGLCRYTPTTNTFRNFTQADGLQSNQFSYNAALITRAGEFLFGGIKGFNMFYPDSIPAPQNALPLFLTALKIDNVPVEQEPALTATYSNGSMRSIIVPFSKASLALDYTAIDYSNAGNLQYAYYLKGWDNGWTSANSSRTANYTHLREGSYTFYVKVKNADGIWSGEKELLSITVLPPWYRTWWAYLLYLVLTGGIVYIIILYNKRQERLKYEVKLALLEKEKEKELTGKKSAFFTHISHEFRAPLSLIINPLQDLVEDIITEPEQKKLVTIQRNAKRLLSLADQLLLFGKADESREEAKVTDTHLYELCHEVFICFIYQAKAKNIDYRFVCDNPELRLFADREKMDIILFNLISNALKFTPKGGQVVFTLQETEHTVELMVSDSGHGIEPEVGDKLFERFYKQNNTYTASKSGFGIGLFLVKQFTDAHKGKLSYKSEVGKGTTFKVVLQKGSAHFNPEHIIEAKGETPLILEELIGDTPQAQPEKAIQPKPEWGEMFSEKKSILLIDDDPEIRDYLEQIFKDRFVLYTAKDGEEGWKIVVQHLPDLVISDVTMSGITGVELCRNIKAEPSLKHIPVILLTASSSSDTKLKGLEGGADDYITKPFEKELLVARVYNILNSRNTLQQYFFDRITLQKNPAKVSGIHKEFLERCIAVVEKNLDNDEFSVEMMMKELNLSHSGLYKKIKAISGQSINSFIRLIRLRKAAVLLLSTDTNISEAAMQVGMPEAKHFRRQFGKLFGMSPSEYVKKYKSTFSGEFTVAENLKK